MTTRDQSPEHELASAYVDHEASAAERARVEASPELRALVESMREIRGLIAIVPAASAAARETAVAAALGEFDRLAPVVSLDRRSRWPQRVLAAAAGVALIGVVGVTVTQNRSDTSRSSSEASAPKLESNTAEDESITAAVPVGDDTFSSMSEPVIIDEPQELLLLPTPSSASADTAPPAEAGTDSATTIALAHRESLNDARRCIDDDQVFLADIIYKGTYAIAVRDTVTGVTEAIDGDCSVLASVSP